MSGWSQLEHAAIDRLSALGPVEIAAYVALLRHVDQDRQCFPSMARIGKVAGVSERRARAAVNALVAAGLVHRQPQTGNNGSTLPPLYYLPLATPQDPAEQNDRGGRTVPGGAEQNDRGEGEQNDPLTRTNRTKTKEQGRGGKAARCTPPSLEEVQAYCLERKNQVDPALWFARYESNGWRVGATTMKDWKASVRYWERNGYSNGNGQVKKQEPLSYRA